jgi:hypothetical protein
MGLHQEGVVSQVGLLQAYGSLFGSVCRMRSGQAHAQLAVPQISGPLHTGPEDLLLPGRGR